MAKAVDVLVIEDNESMRLLIHTHLSMESCVGEIRQASSGEEGVEIVKDFAPDFVVVDCRMPGMGGKAAARHVRALHPNTFIASFSGFADLVADWADVQLSKDTAGLREIRALARKLAEERA